MGLKGDAETSTSTGVFVAAYTLLTSKSNARYWEFFKSITHSKHLSKTAESFSTASRSDTENFDAGHEVEASDRS